MLDSLPPSSLPAPLPPTLPLPQLSGSTGFRASSDFEAPASGNPEAALLQVCPRHPHDRLDMFCTDEQAVCCSHCLLVGPYRGKAFKSLRDAALEAKANLASAAALVDDQSRRIAAYRSQADEARGQVMASCQAARDGLHRMLKEGLDALTVFENTHVESLGRAQDSVIAACEAQAPVVEEQLGKMDKMLRLAQKLYAERHAERWVAETLLAEAAIDALNGDRSMDRVLGEALDVVRQRSFQELGKWVTSVDEHLAVMESVVAIICNPENAADIVKASGARKPAPGGGSSGIGNGASTTPGPPTSTPSASKRGSPRDLGSPSKRRDLFGHPLAPASPESPRGRTGATGGAQQPSAPKSAAKSASKAAPKSATKPAAPGFGANLRPALAAAAAAVPKEQQAEAQQMRLASGLQALVQRVMQTAETPDPAAVPRSLTLPASAYAGTLAQAPTPSSGKQAAGKKPTASVTLKKGSSATKTARPTSAADQGTPRAGTSMAAGKRPSSAASPGRFATPKSHVLAVEDV